MANSAADWVVSEADREWFDRELESFVPERIFDAHAHLYRLDHAPAESIGSLCRAGPRDVGMEVFQQAIGQLLPKRSVEGLFFPYPMVGLDVDAANGFLIEEVRKRPDSRGQMLITPDMDPERIRETVRRDGFVGLKCYHIYSHQKPTFEAAIESFLPEPQVKIAHEEALSITLHMVRPRALADRHNQETIQRYARRYPDMRLILAHAARGFNPHHTIEGIASLRGLGNVWFDTSAVTDAGAFEAIVQTMGPERLLYGADFPVSHLRGRCVALGDSFFWLSAENTQLQSAHANVELGLVGLESLRVLKLAATSLRLADSTVERIFFRNAAELYGLSFGSIGTRVGDSTTKGVAP